VILSSESFIHCLHLCVQPLSDAAGASVFLVEEPVGKSVGEFVGAPVGASVGESVGIAVGISVGISVGGVVEAFVLET